MDVSAMARDRTRAPLVEPPPYGYIHIAAAVEPPAAPLALPWTGRRKSSVLSRLKSYASGLQRLENVERVTVYRAIMIAPPDRLARERARHVARYDVAVLIETSSPDALDEVQDADQYRDTLDFVARVSKDSHVMPARCIRSMGDVDKTRQGLFLFNHFDAEDAEAALKVWERLGGWYARETNLGNSTLLAPMDKADYVFVNHARWDLSLPGFAVRQFAKPSFWTEVRRTLKASGVIAMPILYRRV
jgi:hypothetical protein